jgi:gluconate 2-dehydrogenase gamma chain
MRSDAHAFFTTPVVYIPAPLRDRSSPVLQAAECNFSGEIPCAMLRGIRRSGGRDLTEHMDRRRFLKSAAGSTVVLASIPVLGVPVDHSLALGCRVFTPAQAATVEAITMQFVPADEDPGAKEAGVVFYIDGLLAGRFGKFFKDRYEHGLAMVDQASSKQFGRDFVALDHDQQVTILKALESGDAAGLDGCDFFSLILRHTM